jgi:diguanylate cyclase (GGDEF)-like protein
MAAMIARRFRARLDLWLFVTVLAASGDLVFSHMSSRAPYDLGWYMGIAYGGAASGALLIVLLLESADNLARLAEVHEALVRSNRSLEHLSLHDSLTSLANRRHFDAYLDRQAALSRRHRRELALALFDLDDFKAFNDYFGHQAGDECLTRIAEALKSCSRRPADLAARYGGEEFALILPETDLAGAVQIAETAREAVARLAIRAPPGASRPIMTMSGGVAALEGGEDGSPQSLVAAADGALFEAKRRGRDRVVSTGSRGFIV